ncbi:MAG: type II toxin-antitoxin system HicA family toxin [Lachnospiraceae bacterium]|nr:type II toxin-antitoxin system HicA family toxin [Lachnospiraceae bacterium]
MAKNIYAEIMSGVHDNSIRFGDLRKLLESSGFSCRVKGDHFIYWRGDIPEIVNIQPDGSKAKPYQVKQIRILFEKYGV